MGAHSEFDNPPVVEMAIGVQFRPILALRGINLGPLRELWRSDYPNVQEHPALPPGIEAPPTAGFGLRLGFGAAAAVRHWFVSSTGDLLQVQTDRFIVNWRQGTSDRPYPRYAHMREEFIKRFGQLREFVTADLEGRVGITQAELNYINTLDVVDAGHGVLHQVLRSWKDTVDHHLGAPEQARLAMTFNIPDVGRPPTRLHVSIAPGVRVDGSQGLFLTMTGRGAPAGEQLDDSLKFLDEIHDHLSRSFRELTTDTIQTAWGAQQ